MKVKVIKLRIRESEWSFNNFESALLGDLGDGALPVRILHFTNVGIWDIIDELRLESSNQELAATCQLTDHLRNLTSVLLI